MRVLICEDEEDTARTLQFLLEADGYETAVCFDGQAGLQRSLSFQPHAAVLDIGLPGLDGYTLAQELRKRHAPIFLIALTGYADRTQVARAHASGLDLHLAKPADPRQVLDALNAYRLQRSAN